MSDEDDVTSGEATWKCEDDAVVGRLYYVKLSGAAKPPYLNQRHVTAILDIAYDGTLAGIELIDNMPPPPSPLPTHQETEK